MSASLQVLQRRLGDGKPVDADRYIGMAQESVRRAAALTHRLLAFSRRQTLDPKATDLNRLIAGIEELIRRTVGPSVDVEVVGADGLWMTRIDMPQLENALLNLCINARDAMAPDGGRLTMVTANKWLVERSAAERELPPGHAGHGERADGECVLVVEDEDTIRMLIGEELRELGYAVIAVADGPAALELLQSDRRIDLLLTDVGLPGGLNGRQVADAGRVVRPALKVLFITGYAENAAVGNGLLAHGMAVITKPFDIAALAVKVRDMLER